MISQNKLHSYSVKFSGTAESMGVSNLPLVWFSVMVLMTRAAVRLKRKICQTVEGDA